MTCIGNSGDILKEVEDAIKEGDLCAASVLSGNRNFEGRVHPFTKANFLASPPLVVAFATLEVLFATQVLILTFGCNEVTVRKMQTSLQTTKKPARRTSWGKHGRCWKGRSFRPKN